MLSTYVVEYCGTNLSCSLAKEVVERVKIRPKDYMEICIDSKLALIFQSFVFQERIKLINTHYDFIQECMLKYVMSSPVRGFHLAL